MQIKRKDKADEHTDEKICTSSDIIMREEIKYPMFYGKGN